MLVACIACALAWWWSRSSIATTGSGRVDTWLWYVSTVLCVPGWLIVTKDYFQQATKTTDVLIPKVSGLIWGLLAIVAVKLLSIIRKCIHGPARSR